MRTTRRRVVRPVLAAAVALIALFGLATPAFGTSAASVGTTAASWTPHLASNVGGQRVWQFAQCNGTVFAVGVISSIVQGTASYSRDNGFSFSATTGAVTGWDPKVNGAIRTITISPDCATAYLGGSFSSAGGSAASNVAAVNVTTGARVQGFKASANKMVETLQFTHGALLAGGDFTTADGVSRSRLTSFDPATGALTGYATVPVSGTYPNPNPSPTRIFSSQLSHPGTRLLVEGVFTSIGGASRQQVAVLDLGASSVTVDGWNAPVFNSACAPWDPEYVRAAAWGANDQTIDVATTGYAPVTLPKNGGVPPPALPGGVCDAAASFPATATAVSPTWINYTGCDSYYSIIVDQNDIYVAGHERWANNPLGCDSAGPGAVSRPGIAQLDPRTGLATAWNPTRSLGYGADTMLLTDAGLWVGSDNFVDGSASKCGGQTNHGGVCFFAY